MIVRLGQGIDDREPVDFFVVFSLDIAPGEEAIDAVADAQTVAVLKGGGPFNHAIVDKGAVGAAQIGNGDAALRRFDTSMATRNSVVLDADVAIFAAAN